MLGMVFSIDVCTRHRISSKNVDLNICAHPWYSVSIIGHERGFEFAEPVLGSLLKILIDSINTRFECDSKMMNLNRVQL